MIFRAGIAVGLAGVCLAVPVPAFAQEGGTARPITVTGTGSGPFDIVTGEAHIDGNLIGSHLGKGTLRLDTAPVVGYTAVETGANGDAIFITNDPTSPGPPRPTNCPTNIGIFSGPFAGGEFVTGGTGRFAGATGFLNYSGCLSFTPDASSPTGFTEAFTFTDIGWISY
jgi:hypothetical protein